MKDYDIKYEIRQAKDCDVSSIMNFIDKNWKKGHILGNNREVFEYEFLEDNGDVNFLIALDRETGNIEAISGFLKASHDKNSMDVWGVMWMSRDGNMPFLGLELEKRRHQIVGSRAEIGVGDNPKTSIPIMKKVLNRFTGKMNQYYMIADRDDYQIARIIKKPSFERKNGGRGQIIHFNSIDELERVYDFEKNKQQIPYKDSWYINHRYFQHVSYIYDVCGIEMGDEVTAIIISRNEMVHNRYVTRIVDYIGRQESIKEIGWYFNEMLKETGIEYIDFYNLGFNEEYLRSVGFILRDENDPNIIPNYFHPFLQENVDIWVSSSVEGTLFFKGDADQDRPN